MSERDESAALSAAAAGRCPKCGGPRPDLSHPCPQCGAPALGPADPAGSNGEEHRGSGMQAMMQVRTSDLEPYVGLSYLSRLFKVMAVILILVLVAEVITGLVSVGRGAIPALLGEASRLIVGAGLLWGAGDLALLLIDIGHDLRATRILIGRQTAHHLLEHMPSARPAVRPSSERRGPRSGPEAG